MDKIFWKATAIRATRTFLQCILGVWTAGTVITAIDWKTVLLAAISAAIYSVLNSLLTGLPEVESAQYIHMDAEEPLDSFVVEEGEDDEE